MRHAAPSQNFPKFSGVAPFPSREARRRSRSALVRTPNPTQRPPPRFSSILVARYYLKCTSNYFNSLEYEFFQLKIVAAAPSLRANRKKRISVFHTKQPSRRFFVCARSLARSFVPPSGLLRYFCSLVTTKNEYD